MTLITIDVEDCLFRVPVDRLREGSKAVLKRILLTSLNDAVDAERVVTLDAVSKKDFRAFLGALYPKTHGIADHLPPDDWLAVLRLSHEWSFQRLKITSLLMTYVQVECNKYHASIIYL